MTSWVCGLKLKYTEEENCNNESKKTKSGSATGETVKSQLLKNSRYSVSSEQAPSKGKKSRRAKRT